MTTLQAYSVLGLELSATPDEIRLRFWDLMRSNHPDVKPSHEQILANEKTLIIIQACRSIQAQNMKPSLSYRYRDHRLSDSFTWIDEVWNECIDMSLVCPAFGIRMMFGAWAMGWNFMFGFNFQLPTKKLC
jgi:hypothetical protein